MEDIKLFYKYQSFDEQGYTLENLKKNQLYFRHPTDFNDPSDCKLNYVYKGKKEQWFNLFRQNDINRTEAEEYLKYNLKRGWFKQEGFYIIFDPTNEDYRKQEHKPFHGDFHSTSLPLVACFTEVNNDILMWSHYADKHKGICLCFKANKESNNYIIVLDSRLRGDFSKIDYEENMPNPFNMLDLKERHKHILQGLCTKSYIWGYENEWRLIVSGDEFKKNNVDRYDEKVCGGKMNYDKNDLEGVIFGLKISHKDAESVFKIIHGEYWEKGIKVNFYQAKEVRGEYGIQIEPIHDVNEYLASLRQ